MQRESASFETLGPSVGVAEKWSKVVPAVDMLLIARLQEACDPTASATTSTEQDLASAEEEDAVVPPPQSFVLDEISPSAKKHYLKMSSLREDVKTLREEADARLAALDDAREFSHSLRLVKRDIDLKLIDVREGFAEALKGFQEEEQQPATETPTAYSTSRDIPDHHIATPLEENDGGDRKTPLGMVDGPQLHVEHGGDNEGDGCAMM